MLPSGMVVIDGKTYDAVSEGVPIEAEQTVLVVGVSTQRLVVRPDTTIRAELAERGCCNRRQCRSNGPANRRSVCRVGSLLPGGALDALQDVLTNRG